MNVTTDRLITLGQTAPIDSERAWEIYLDRVAAFDRELDIAKSLPSLFYRELIVVTSVDARQFKNDRLDVDELLGRLVVMRITGESIAATMDPGTSSKWFQALLRWGNDNTTRIEYALTTPVEELRTLDSELCGDLEVFLR